MSLHQMHTDLKHCSMYTTYDRTIVRQTFTVPFSNTSTLIINGFVLLPSIILVELSGNRSLRKLKHTIRGL